MGRPNTPCFKIDVPTIANFVAPTTTLPPIIEIQEAGIISIPPYKPDCDSSAGTAGVNIEILQHPQNVLNFLENDYATFSVVAQCNFPAILEYNWHIGSVAGFFVSSSTLINSGNGDGTIFFGPVVKNNHNNKFLKVEIKAHTQYGTVSKISNAAQLTVK